MSMLSDMVPPIHLANASRYDPEPGRMWMQRHWSDTLIYGLMYALMVFYGPGLMKSRPSMDSSLKPVLVIWNTALCVFSVWGAYYAVPELIEFVKERGIVASMCVEGGQYHGIVGFWGWLFILSKVPELLDTLFLVLRKRRIIFLHWYHHLTVVVYSWLQYCWPTACGRWGVAMNFSVHSLMYGYYGVRSMGMRTPKLLSMFITSMQILQMIVGTIVCIFVTFVVVNQGRDACTIHPVVMYYQLVMYSSYLFLFAQFFYRSYIVGGKSKIE